MNSPDYKRGYSSGYNAGRKESSAAQLKFDKESLISAQRAERAESGAGIGHCDECVNWVRPTNCNWGYCEASRAAGSPWGCWAQGPEMPNSRDFGRITTTPKFGCVLFSQKAKS